MSKLQRCNATDQLPPVNPSSKELESFPHPRKPATRPSAAAQKRVNGQGPAEAEGESVRPSGSRHPQGHKVKTYEEWQTAILKNGKGTTKYLPLSDTIGCGDTYFQPRSIIETGSTMLTVMFEVLVDADQVYTEMKAYGVSADDLLKMFYLAEKADCVYFNTELEEGDDFELWYNHKFAEYAAANAGADIADRGAVAAYLFAQYPQMFIIGKGSFMEVYFQKHCVHEYIGANRPKKNPNIVCCPTPGGKFEYVIEMRVFILNDDIHERKLGDMFDESQAS